MVSKVPPEKALREVRRRLGTAPLQGLFEVVSGPLARPSTAGVSYRLSRTVAFDGRSSLQAPDTLRVRGRWERPAVAAALRGTRTSD
ncbi:hypothetical protein [Streptomyces sp. NPDC056707]|uniref:hypothetical protein n=1 Tax=Streptomyces sp. NPDC056707 TaxID=3345919 RepID=UPI0036BBFB43